MFIIIIHHSLSPHTIRMHNNHRKKKTKLNIITTISADYWKKIRILNMYNFLKKRLAKNV